MVKPRCICRWAVWSSSSSPSPVRAVMGLSLIHICTLLDPDGQITAGSKDAISQARAAGVRVVLNTGRAFPEAAFFAREAGCDGLISALGGAVLGDWTTGQVLRRWDIPSPTDRRVLELSLEREIELMIFAGGQIVLDPFSKQSLLGTYHYPVFHDNAVVTDDPIGYLARQGLPLTKVHGDGKPGCYPLAELAALDGVQLTASNDHDFELVAAGVDKGRTLALLAMMYGISLAQCAAVGDSDNDLPALLASGTPIAMGNASHKLKAAAKYIAASNGADGVADAILYCLSL